MKFMNLFQRVIASVFVVVGINGLWYKENTLFYFLFTMVAVYIFVFPQISGKNHGDSGDFGDSDEGD